MARSPVDLERRAEIGRERRAKTRAKIIAAAFELFGHENGLFSRVEDIADRAGVTRPTFYNHFKGMEELREALSDELTHDFLAAVTQTVSQMADPRQRAASAIRYYLRRAREDRPWAWSILNMSANGVIMGSETYRQAEQTVIEGMEAGMLPIPSSAIGRDIILGSTLAAIGTLLRDDPPSEYCETVAGYILLGLGVPFDDARRLASVPLPPLPGKP
ncbi:AcrR family transcriptional regulator [Altererythrobacter atlanticus]|uniref:HTH-type transcriptional regulator TtgR n=1 Tax=Croceibacterium atlanticum TaxID=1267766 RepID=A0A0F7KWT4_9SPHN|nr:TetR/AcrR family transcriptional regulator [Croceibacterium atlanticum]AKH44129.1 HTH-type transcriptional regulator TtgR [Croceibacterium atlanticum]MBB5732439.1 AcrR family transcriptional regulator [Croceibacterium atlanticum]